MPFDFYIEVDKYLGKCEENNSRLQAYDICHEKFVVAINTKSYNRDELALHLYAFLASYGMVCRKSILLQHNYRFLIDIVRIVCDKKYESLLDINPFTMSFSSNKYINMVLELKDELSKCLKLSNGSNDTLTSKIMLGTLGCVPAYDKYVKKSLKKLCLCKNFSKKGLQGLIDFTRKYKDAIIRAKNACSAHSRNYSVMKLLDCVLWACSRQ